MTIDMAVSIAGVIALIALVAVLAQKQIFRELPFFSFYIAWGLFGTVLAVAAMSYFPHFYLTEWIIETCSDTVVYLIALAELRNRLVRYNRASSSGWQFELVLFVLNCLILKSLSGWTVPLRYPPEWRFSVHTMQATAVLELAGLLALIEGAVLRRFRWPDRELRIVSGFGFSGVATMTVAFLYSYPFIYKRHEYWWSVVASASNLAVLIYWLRYFLFEDREKTKCAEVSEQLMAVGARDEGDRDPRSTTAQAI